MFSLKRKYNYYLNNLLLCWDKNFHSCSSADKSPDQRIIEYDSWQSYIENIQEFDGMKHMLYPSIPRMTAMLVPSIAEGFSFTMLESMIVGGITVVGPLYGGPKDVIKNNYNGFTFKPGDGKDLAKVLTKLLQLNDLELRVIRDNAVKTALTYSFSRYWNTLSTFFPR